MADISAIKLPNNETYDLKDKNALPLTGGQVTGPVTFGDTISVDNATLGTLIVNGNASFTNNIQANTINGVTVGSSPKFTDTDEKVKANSVSTTSEMYPILDSYNAAASTKSIFSDFKVRKISNILTLTLGGVSSTPTPGKLALVSDQPNTTVTLQTSATADRTLTLPDKTGTIALTSDITTHTTTTATLTTTWTSNQQSVTVSGVTTSNTIIVTPAPASYDAYCEAGIYCSAQAANSLTFKCEEAPSSSLTVNILIIN